MDTNDQQNDLNGEEPESKRRRVSNVNEVTEFEGTSRMAQVSKLTTKSSHYKLVWREPLLEAGFASWPLPTEGVNKNRILANAVFVALAFDLFVFIFTA